MRNVLLDLVPGLAVARLAQAVPGNRSHLPVDLAKAAKLTVARTIADVTQLHHHRLHVLNLALHLGGRQDDDGRGFADGDGRLGHGDADRSRLRAGAVMSFGIHDSTRCIYRC